MIKFNQKLIDILRLSKETTQALSKLNIFTIKDLLFYLPYRYEDRTTIYKIADLIIDKSCLFYGRILEIEQRGKTLNIIVMDDSGFRCKIIYLHYNNLILAKFKNNKEAYFFAKIAKDKYGDFSVFHPEIIWCKKGELYQNPNLEAIYYTTKKLPLRELRLLIAVIFKQLNLEENFNKDDYLTKLGFYSFAKAVKILHQPKLNTTEAKFIEARKRLVMEEILNHAAKMQVLREKITAETFAKMQKNLPLFADFLQNLPFELTMAQERVIKEITTDMSQNNAMMRLIQGDVGCGKTVVALAAAIMAIANGFQVAFLTPTEILAQQHYKNICNLLDNLELKVELLTAKTSKTQIVKNIANGTVNLIVGTHALFQEKVQYQKLGLIIIDEQHRFGVGQRMAMLKKSEQDNKFAHQLYLTATPIPRTLQLADYGELNYSKIDELPKGRMPVKTVKIENAERDYLLERVKLQCQQGKQAFWICPMIEETEKSKTYEWETAEQTAENFRIALPDLKISVIHSKTKKDEQEQIITDFSAGKIDILVATTIVEVGMDIPNATMMIIENSNKFGLAQLHQLRGRVGRNNQQSYCILLYKTPLEEVAQKRLNIMRKTNDGFEIAEQDLILRGGGEFIGNRQSGKTEFLLADLGKDRELFIQAQDLIKKLYQQQKNFLKELENRWGSLEDDLLQG